MNNKKNKATLFMSPSTFNIVKAIKGITKKQLREFLSMKNKEIVELNKKIIRLKKQIKKLKNK